MELNAVAEPELERIANLGGADVVIGMLNPQAAPAMNGTESCGPESLVRQAFSNLPDVARVLVVCDHLSGSAAPVPENVAADQKLAVFFCPLTIPGPTETTQQSLFNSYRSVLSIGQRLGVRGCAVLASQAKSASHQSIYSLLHPVLELGFDLAAPRYARHKTEGLLNKSILAPLNRALYGQQLRNPMGPDFGLSGKLLKQVWTPDPRRSVLASIASTAEAGGFQVCESHLGARLQPSTDWMNLSSLLAEILGPVFLEMERRASFWQSLRESKSLAQFGSSEPLPEDRQAVDVRQMVDSFHLGIQNLLDVWGLVLPPTSLLELRKLSRLPIEQFRMPDELWVRIVYDFALGHRLRTISRDHLLRSITPLYLGWIASYALELETAAPAEIVSRLERLSRAYETNKAYLVSRWRWPDRFNP